jgi:hypothetical protein
MSVTTLSWTLVGTSKDQQVAELRVKCVALPETWCSTKNIFYLKVHVSQLIVIFLLSKQICKLLLTSWFDRRCPGFLV